ncbi:SDR family oxidoreductase [Mucilaginibacter calamicampi]|uniref:SDR family oxidoreductase n=1 Tax=Mucilaginibacter calamicampi TaxID=1302352 RepID=A0ABW2YUZ5_9SPHI
MQVFVTGASGFVGSAVVKELLNNGHKVLGLVRSENGAQDVAAMGAEVLLGDVNDEIAITKAAQRCDAIIHTAFNHDFTQYKASCEADRRVISIFTAALAGTQKPLVVTSGVGLISDGREVTELDALPAGADKIPRAASEEAANEAMTRGINAYIVRLSPSVHGKGDHGFVPMVIDMARAKDESVYVGDGSNLWPGVHRNDAAALYRLVIEKQPGLRVLNAVAERGVPFRGIAEVIGKKLNIPVKSKTGEQVAEHFGWLAHFAAVSCPSVSEHTRNALGWQPTNIGLIDDINANYF